MKKIITHIGVAFFIILVLSGCLGGTQETSIDDMSVEDQEVVSEESSGDSTEELNNDASSSAMQVDELIDETENLFAQDAAAALSDVTGGKAMGEAWSILAEDGTHHRLIAQDLPPLTNGDFYEGWIVSSPQAIGGVVSTGVLEQQEDGMWLLDFTSKSDLLDHRTVVLTLEPNDGDPAPAKHVLEGTL